MPLGLACASAPASATAISGDDASRPAKRLRPGPAASSGQPPCDSPMHLTRVTGVPSWANEGFLGFTLGDMVCGKIKRCLCSTMGLEVPWLLDTCPDLWAADELDFVIDERPGHRGKDHSCDKCRQVETREALRCLFKEEEGAEEGGGRPRWVVHVPPGIACTHGRHHSKFFLLQYDIGLRFIGLTGNLQSHQHSHQTQAAYVQDFPLKEPSSCGSASQGSSPFEVSLAKYLAALDLPKLQADHWQDVLKKHDFSSARVELVTSVPGRHDSADFGHWRLAALLTRNGEGFPERFAGSPVVAQASSIGSVTDDGWLSRELTRSLWAGYVSAAPAGEAGTAASSPEQRQLGPGKPRVVWPTVEEVRTSSVGYFAGNQLRTVLTNFGDMQSALQQYLRSWGGKDPYDDPAGRLRSMPHCKIYCRVLEEEGEMAWVLWGSHNVSKAAWGAVQPSDGRLKILSYELSVLSTPALERAYQRSRHRGFSCTSKHPHLGPLPGLGPTTPVRFTAWQEGDLQAPSLRPAISSNGGSSSSSSSSSSGGDEGGGGTFVVTLPLPLPLKGRPLVGDECPWARPDLCSFSMLVTDQERAAWKGRMFATFRWDEDRYGLPYGAYRRFRDEIKTKWMKEEHVCWRDVVSKVEQAWSGTDECKTAQQERRHYAQKMSQELRDMR